MNTSIINYNAFALLEILKVELKDTTVSPEHNSKLINLIADLIKVVQGIKFDETNIDAAYKIEKVIEELAVALHLAVDIKMMDSLKMTFRFLNQLLYSKNTFQ